jgi:hypothetical protein
MISRHPFRRRKTYRDAPWDDEMQAALYHARKRRLGDGTEYVPPTAFLHDFTASDVTAVSYTVGCDSLEAGGDITLAVRNIPWTGSVADQRLLILGTVDDGTVIYRETKPNQLSNTFTAAVTEGAVPHYCAFLRTIQA